MNDAKGTSGDTRSVTIALLTRNAGPILARVLDAVARQVSTRSVEVLAVDSCSSDGTVGLLEDSGARVIPIAPEAFNFGSARELAFEKSSGEIVVNLSQDAVPAHDQWLERLVEPLADEGVGLSCGRSVPDPERGFAQFPWERNGYFYFTREMKRFTARYGKGVSFANSAVSRQVWQDLRFDPMPLGEDFLFQTKMHGGKFRAVFPSGAEVLHHHDYDLSTLYKRCRDEGTALRMLGFPYREWDLLCDLAGPAKYVQWLRELQRGSLRTAAAALFPILRPMAVYIGSRFDAGGIGKPGDQEPS